MSLPDPRLQIEHLPLSAITLDPENARVHKKAQIRQIAASIEAFNFNVPVLVDRDNKILSGHGRVLALQKLGRADVPVIRLEHLTPAQARAFAIADNRLTETSSWDERLLAQHFKTLAELDLDFSIEATGFTIGEIDLKIEGLDIADEEPDPDDAPLPPGPPVCRHGDLWILGDHRVLCGDALDEKAFERLMEGQAAAAVFTDPPYNVPVQGHISGKGKRRHREFAVASGEMTGPEFTTFLTCFVSLAVKFSAPGSVHFVCIDWRHIHNLLAAGASAYNALLNICVWTKNNGGMGSLYRSAHELVAVFRNGAETHRNNVQLGRFGRNRTNVWAYPGANTFLRGSEEADLLEHHPTPKPVALVADAVLDVTARRDLILDCFLGSGSTLVACERIGRRCRGLELDPLYVDLSIRRWQRMTGENAVHARSGKTFDALAAAAKGDDE